MARYTGPSCKLCRREGKKLFLKGDRCLTDKCAVARRATVPGQHGARRYYGVQEKQFKKYYVAADNQEGIAGENLLSLLERRFDNVVYRMGMASSRKEARQLVRHAHFTLNGKKADIPSIILKVGDVVALKEKSRSSEKLKELMENMASVNAPKWLEVNADAASAKVIAVPAREDVDFDFNEQLIIKFYSK